MKFWSEKKNQYRFWGIPTYSSTSLKKALQNLMLFSIPNPPIDETLAIPHGSFCVPSITMSRSVWINATQNCKIENLINHGASDLAIENYLKTTTSNISVADYL